MRDRFEAYIDLSLREEISRIPEYYQTGRGRGFWVAELPREPRLAGFYGLEADRPDAVELRRMYVEPEFRRRGIGSALLCDAERRARLLGCSKIILSTSELQGAALSLYRKHGYDLLRTETAAAATVRTIGGGIVRFHLQKQLAPT